MQNEVLSKKKRLFIYSLYFLIYLLGYSFLLTPVLVRTFGIQQYLILDCIVGIILILCLVLCTRKWLLEQWKHFYEHFWHSILTVLLSVFFLYLVAILFNILIAYPYQLGQAENQLNNNLLMQLSPMSFLLNTLVIAPIVEDLVFRGCMFQTIYHKYGFWIGALISGFIFGFLHIIPSIQSGSWINLLYILNYGGCGFVLAYPMAKTNSIWASILTHACFNLLGILLALL